MGVAWLVRHPYLGSYETYNPICVNQLNPRHPRSIAVEVCSRAVKTPVVSP